jgi:CIC family chloride channel protein
LVLTLFFKALACCITVEAGGIGGIFAPTLFMGSTLGYIFTKVIDFFKLDVNQGQFSLIGMSALVSGIIHAPLTGIFLIAEITGGYTLFIPLMISSSIAYLISRYYEPKSIYNKILEQQGDHISHHKDKIILNRIDLCKLIEKDFSPVQYKMSLGELVQVIKRSRRNIFPVVNEENVFMGIVNLDDVRDIMFNTNKYDNVFISDLIHPPTAQVDINTKMEDVMNAFKKSGAWNIVVTEDGKYCGFISRSKIFNVYRRTLVEFSDD